MHARGRGIGDGRWWGNAHTVEPGDPGAGALAATTGPAGRRTVVALMLLAVSVQLLVWGRAPATGDGGAMLPGLRPVFGVAYAAVLLALELAFCAYHGLRDGVVVVLLSAAGVDIVFWSARLGGLDFPTGAAAALTAGFGAVALGAGVLTGRIGGESKG